MPASKAYIVCLLIALTAGVSLAQFDQPSPPFHATFFYPWHPIWSDNGHSPPLNWFSNYLPDPNPCVFDPVTELYNSMDDATIYWQLRKMAQARLEVAISSWWGQGHKTDGAFRKIITDVMERADNPYPNLRWALYYEKESLGDPPVEELVTDLNYIRGNYAGRRAYLRINDKPVIFVYAAGGDAAGMAARWAAARAQANFYVVLKVYSGYRSDPNQPDSWHQYAPANRTDNQQPYSFMVSPGFWLDGQAPRLPRDLAAFRAAVAQMVALPVPWKLVETWNEWGEGTSVEPGEQVLQTRTGAAAFDPAGAPFKNLYVEALQELLPPLEHGTGAAASDAEPRFTAAGTVNAAALAAGAVAPGEILTIFGERLGPASGTIAVATSAGGIPTTLAGVRVFFDCTPAPLLYVQAGQINAVVPYAVAGKTATEVRVEFQARQSYAATLAVTDSAPAIFALDGSGRGQAAALNEDYSVNSASNPAARGSIVMLFGTGEGATNPDGVDGKLAVDRLPAPRLPVSVTMGGTRAEVTYAGAAPNFVAGALQVNARVPPGLQPGASTPVSLTIGGHTSPGVTLAIR